MSYNRDLRDTELKSLFQRHQDSYSANELQGEIYLVTSFISQLLSNADLTGNFNRQEIISLIELKRRLLESQSKLKNTAFREEALVRQMELRERLADALTREDVAQINQYVTSVLLEYLPQNKLEEASRKLTLMQQSLVQK